MLQINARYNAVLAVQVKMSTWMYLLSDTGQLILAAQGPEGGMADAVTA
jgi:hypothetical protein